MRKEDGLRFFNPRLLRNLKLVCDFGGSLNEFPDADPLAQLANWRESVCCTVAQNLLNSLGFRLEAFYKEAMSHKEIELVESLHKSLMALMLAANPHLLSRSSQRKCCSDYFKDFQVFLRDVLSCRDYP